MPNKSTPNNNPREISDLTFNEQVFIWALRMKLRGEEFFKKVVAHCEKIYPGQRPVFPYIQLKWLSILYGTMGRNHSR